MPHGESFHLVLEAPQANLVAGMKWFLGADTSRFNRRHRLFGHLFCGRYRALVVDGSGDGYLRTVCDDVHLNPVRARLLTPEQPLCDYPWGSILAYVKPPSQRPGWLRVDRLLRELGIGGDDLGSDRAALADGLPTYACQLSIADARLTIAGTDPFMSAITGFTRSGPGLVTEWQRPSPSKSKSPP